MTELLTAKELASQNLVRSLKTEIERNISGACLIDESLAGHTSWRVGGKAKFYVFPQTADDAASLIQLCRVKRLAHFTIGYGTNLLVSDDGFPGCTIDLTRNFRKIEIKNAHVVVDGGVWLSEAVRKTAENGLAGMEKLAGIPGGVGGGLSMNAGAFGMAISDCLTSLMVLDDDGKKLTLKKEEIEFAYRSAPGLEARTVVSAEFYLRKDRASRVERIVAETLEDRVRRNTMLLPSAGSVFKNPANGFAAKMIEAVGGKGMGEGGVEVSRKHANFIINRDSGNASDIVRLIRRIRAMVADKFGVELKLEVRTLGFGVDFL